jgi:hypothetical protein
MHVNAWDIRAMNLSVSFINLFDFIFRFWNKSFEI